MLVNLTENVNFIIHLRLFERGTFYFVSKGLLVQSNINVTYYGKSYDLYECIYTTNGALHKSTSKIAELLEKHFVGLAPWLQLEHIFIIHYIFWYTQSMGNDLK